MSKTSKSKPPTPHEGAVAAHGQGDPAIHHETTDVRVRPLAYAGLALVAMTITAFTLISVLLSVLNGADRGTNTLIAPPAPAVGSELLAGAAPLPTAVPTTIPGPNLQVDGKSESDRIIGAQTVVIESYGWVDQNAGVVHIPIERAMALIVERGVTPKAAP